MTTVLLSGAGGFAGHHCLEHILTTTDWNVVATDSFRHKGTTDRIAQVLSGQPEWQYRVSVITHDLSAPFSRQTMLDLGRRGIDYVIGYASDSHVDRSIADPVAFTANNTGIAVTTLELCRELKPKALVWISTDEVYGPLAKGEEPFAEWSAILPSSPYAASKAAQEALCTAYWRTYGVPAIIVNSMNLFGERQDPEKFIPRVTGAALEGREVTIHGRPGEIGTRHWLHARNLADGVCFLLKNTVPAAFQAHSTEAVRRNGNSTYKIRFESRPDRYNIAAADQVDNLTLAGMIAESAGRPLYYRLQDFDKARPGHDPHYGLTPGKIEALGWRPPVPFATSLDRTVQWSIKNRDWLEE